MNPSSPTGDEPLTALSAFQGYAEAQSTAALSSLMARAAKPALAELEALRVALDVRCVSLAATLAGIGNIDLAPVQELVDRLAQAAAAEVNVAAQTARTIALDEAQVRLELERADARQQLESARADASAQRAADRLEQAALADALEHALEKAKSENDAIGADRDAQLEAARAQIDAIRVDRDTQLESARAAQAARERADQVCADRNAQLEIAMAQVVALRADRDAQLEAAGARLDATRADLDAQLEAARAQIDALRGDRDTQLETAKAAQAAMELADHVCADWKAQLEIAVAQVDAIRADRDAQLEVAGAQIDAIRADRDAHAEAIRAARAQQTQLLEETHAQLEAVHMDTERCLAARAGEIEMLRGELEEARAAVQRSRAEVSHVEQPESQPAIVQAGVHTHEPPEAPVGSTDAPSSPDQVADPFGAVCRAVDEAAHLSQVLDALIDGVGAVFPRAALFVVKSKSKRLQGWRSVGFTGVAAITKEFEFSLATDSALTRAVNAGRVVFTGEAAPDGQTAGRPGDQREAWTVTFPVMTGDRVVAVVHADGGGRNGEQAPAFDREAALEIGRVLVLRAGERLAVLTTSARTAFGNIIGDTPATSAAAAVAHSAAPPLQVAAQGKDAGNAGRVASQLVSEINRYKQPAGPADRNLHGRIVGEIAGRCDLQAAPEPSGPALGLLDEAVGKMLGGGDLDLRGQSERTAAAEQPLLSGRT